MNFDSFKNAFSGAVVLFIGLIIDKAFSFGSTVIVARYLSLSDFGLVSLGRTLMIFATLISLFGLDKGISRYLPREKNTASKRDIMSSATQMAFGVGLLSTAILYFLIPQISRTFSLGKSEDILQIFIISIPILIGFRIILGGIRGTEKALPRVYSQHIARPASNIIIIAVVIIFDLKTSGVAWSYPLSYIIGGFVALYFLTNQVPIRLLKIYDQEAYMKLISFSAPLVVSGLMYRVLSDIDVFLLGYLTTSLDTVGIYKIIYPFSSLLLLILTAFGYMALPIISKLDSEGKNEEIQDTYLLVSKWTFLFSLPITIIMLFFPETLISLTFGEKYLPGTVAFQILVVGFSIHTMVGPNGNTLQAIGNSKALMYCNLVAAVVNIALNFILISEMGIEGAAIATAVSYGLMNFFYTYLLYMNGGIIPITREELIILSISVLSMGLISPGMGYIIHRQLPYVVASFTLFTIIYFGLIAYFGIERVELEILSDIQKRYPVPGISILIRWAS